MEASPLWVEMSMFAVLVTAFLVGWGVLCSAEGFDPYVDHGGTVVGLAGRDFCVLASDTRLSQGYMIHSRNHSRILEVSSGCGVAGSGCWSDMRALGDALRHNAKVYEWQGRRSMSLGAMSNLLAAIMYGRRMFPYFTFTILGGLDQVGRGALFRYDAVGSFERVQAVCAGKGEQLMQPALDRLTNMEEDAASWRVTGIDDVFESAGENFVDLSVDEACAAVLEAYRSAAEREITIGDGVEMMVVERDATTDDGGGGGDRVDCGTEGRSSTSRQPWQTRTRWLSYPLAKH